jgi:two-component system NarL family response regulator
LKTAEPGIIFDLRGFSVPNEGKIGFSRAVATSPELKAARIVLVEDHEMVREGLRLRLELEPDFAIVGQAGTIAEAERLLERGPANVVILDVTLPDGNGIAAVRRIHAARPELKILILTSMIDPQAANEAVMAGAHGFMRKEERSDELVRAVRTILAGKVYLSPDAATAVAQALRDPPKSGPALSGRERRVLQLVAEGMSYKQIADDLGVSVKSVETYRARLARKIDCSTRADLVRYAVRTGLVPP